MSEKIVADLIFIVLHHMFFNNFCYFRSSHFYMKKENRLSFDKRIIL